MKARKYELTDQHHPSASWLRRIRALVDIPRVGVCAGDLGGWVESGPSGCDQQAHERYAPRLLAFAALCEAQVALWTDAEELS